MKPTQIQLIKNTYEIIERLGPKALFDICGPIIFLFQSLVNESILPDIAVIFNFLICDS